MTYFIVTRGGGVFATGNAIWVPSLWNNDTVPQDRLGFGRAPSMEPLTTITLNVLRALANLPGSVVCPSIANWNKYYSPLEKVALGADV